MGNGEEASVIVPHLEYPVKKIDWSEHYIDPGVFEWVKILNEHGVETYEACQGGEGHAYTEPTIRFHGDRGEGFRALAIALTHKWPVLNISRVWTIEDDEPTGPHWQMVFSRMHTPNTLTMTEILEKHNRKD